MRTHTNAEHDPQHQHEGTQRSYEAPTFPRHVEKKTGQDQQEKIDKNKTREEGKTDESIISGMTILKKSRLSFKNVFGRHYHHYRYLVTGTVEQWRTLLSKVNTHQKFDTYVTPFLAAAGASDYSIERKPHTNSKDHVFLIDGNGKIGEKDILNFLLALYDAGSKHDSKLNFPDEWHEDSFAPDLVNRFGDGLAKFITLHQHKLIANISENQYEGTKIIDSFDVKTLANEGTYWASGDNRVKEALMKNAICSALVGATRVLNAKIAHNFGNVEDERMIGLKMVQNSGRIIKGVIDENKAHIIKLEGQIGAALGIAWGLIPVAAPVRKLFEIYKANVFTKMTKRFKIGDEFNNIEHYRQKLGDAFEDVLDASFDLQQAKLYSEEHKIDLAISTEKDANWYTHIVREFRENI